MQEEVPAAREEPIKADPPVEPQVPSTANGVATEEIVEKKKKKVSHCTTLLSSRDCKSQKLGVTLQKLVKSLPLQLS